EPAHVGAVDVAVGDLEDERHAAVVVIGAVGQIEIARTEEVARTRFDVRPPEFPRHSGIVRRDRSYGCEMAGFTTGNSISAKSSGALHRADAIGGDPHGGVARRAGFVLGQRAIGGAESQCQRHRLATVADLRAGVDVEQPDVLEQFARAVAHGVDHRLRGDVLTDDQLTSWKTAGNGDTAGAGSVSVIGMASRSSSTAQLPFGRPARSTTAGCSWPACPTTVSPTSTSAQRPGCHGRYCAARSVNSTPAARPMTRTASNASHASPGGPRPQGPAGSRRPARTTPTCCGCRGSDASRVAISASVGLRLFGMRSTARVSEVGSTTWAIAYSAVSTAPRDTLRPKASNSPGSSVVASRGRSDSSGLSTSVAVRRGSSAGRPHWSNTPAGRNGVGRISM